MWRAGNTEPVSRQMELPFQALTKGSWSKAPVKWLLPLPLGQLGCQPLLAGLWEQLQRCRGMNSLTAQFLCMLQQHSLGSWLRLWRQDHRPPCLHDACLGTGNAL